MSILKSTNSGGQKVLTIQDLLDRGWRFVEKRSSVTLPLSGGGISGGGITGRPIVDKTKMCFINNENWMDVVQEGSQLYLETSWTHEEVYEGKDYLITKVIRPRTLLDFECLEKYFSLLNLEDKIRNNDYLFTAGFTTTEIELKPTMDIGK